MPNFWKMQALGNDFVIWDNIQATVSPHTFDIKTLCDRHLGIGCDQMIFIESAETADYACRFFNTDGSEAEQCGNGIRCVAAYLFLTQQLPATAFTLQTKAGMIGLTYHTLDKITVNMGLPEFEPAKIPFLCDTQQNNYSLNVDNLSATILSMGNPHAIIEVANLQTFPIASYGAKIAQLPVFPNSVNVGFMKVINSQLIQLQTFERGVGITHACGTNACAAVIAGIINQKLSSFVEVQLTYGSLWIEWRGPGHPVFMTGPAVKVFEGKI